MPEVPDIKIVRERCVKCGDCVLLCPQSGEGVDEPVLVLAEGGEVVVGRREGCIACYTCVEFCRAAALFVYHADTHEDEFDAFPARPTNRIV